MVIAIIGLAILLFEGVWVLGLWNGKTCECIKYCLMVHGNRSMEDSDAECDLMNCGGLMKLCDLMKLKRFQKRIIVYCLEIVPMIFGKECGSISLF